MEDAQNRMKRTGKGIDFSVKSHQVGHFIKEMSWGKCDRHLPNPGWHGERGSGAAHHHLQCKNESSK